ncbi:Basic proline-rich protein precursor [Pseudonocardia sp. Ae707_Ps1]|nr:Basic proline-rich protein precursor [Pseudonocardia sp. Ae707_Ps1]
MGGRPPRSRSRQVLSGDPGAGAVAGHTHRAGSTAVTGTHPCRSVKGVPEWTTDRLTAPLLPAAPAAPATTGARAATTDRTCAASPGVTLPADLPGPLAAPPTDVPARPRADGRRPAARGTAGPPVSPAPRRRPVRSSAPALRPPDVGGTARPAPGADPVARRAPATRTTTATHPGCAAASATPRPRPSGPRPGPAGHATRRPAGTATAARPTSARSAPPAAASARPCGPPAVRRPRPNDDGTAPPSPTSRRRSATAPPG